MHTKEIATSILSGYKMDDFSADEGQDAGANVSVELISCLEQSWQSNMGSGSL